MAPKKPVKPTKLQQKAAQKNKVLTGPKGSKPQGTTTNRVRTQGGTTMSKPAPSAGRRINPKAAKPKPVAPKPTPKPTRPSIGNVRGPATSPKLPTRPSIGNVSGPASNPKRPSTGTTSAQRIQNRVNAGVGRGAVERAALKGGAKLLGKAALPVAIAAQVKDVVGGFQKLGNSPFVQKIVKGGKLALSAGSRTNPKAAKPAAPKPSAPKGPSASQRQALDSQERKARQKLSARKASTKSSSATPNTAKSFDSAFKDARRAKVATFTWRGKKYTTQVK